MGTRIFRIIATRTSLLALVIAGAAAGCSTPGTAARPTMTVTAGQAGYVALPDTSPAPASYALTGERSQNDQALRDWQAQAGPVYGVGNGRIPIAPTR